MPDAPREGENPSGACPSFRSSLCFPGTGRSCFACCPPIRPAGYDHLDHRPMIRRMLRENTAAFGEKGTGFSPITGFSCWALGYLDPEYRLVGCLLHPARNGGMDLRFRVGYGEKCSREICPEAKRFGDLREVERGFWSRLANGLDAFEYSSRKTNPLFRILGWGPLLLGAVAGAENGRMYTRESFFRAYPFFSTRMAGRSAAYPAERVVAAIGPSVLKGTSFPEDFERLPGLPEIFGLDLSEGLLVKGFGFLFPLLCLFSLFRVKRRNSSIRPMSMSTGCY